jgi:hypothetical protein
MRFDDAPGDDAPGDDAPDRALYACENVHNLVVVPAAGQETV